MNTSATGFITAKNYIYRLFPQHNNIVIRDKGHNLLYPANKQLVELPAIIFCLIRNLLHIETSLEKPVMNNASAWEFAARNQMPLVYHWCVHVPIYKGHELEVRVGGGVSAHSQCNMPS